MDIGGGVNGRGVGSGEVAVGAKVGVGRSVPNGIGTGVSVSAGGVKKKGVIVVVSRVGSGELHAVDHKRSTRRTGRMSNFLDTQPL